MARIVQSLTQPLEKYDQTVQQSFVRDVDSIVTKLNTSYQKDLKDFPNQTKASSTLGPFAISSSSTKIDTRARAREISLKVENTSTTQFWKLGTFRLDIQPDGRR